MTTTHATPTHQADVDGVDLTSASASAARFVAGLRLDAVPAPVLVRSRHLVLDAVGVALAATTYDFAPVATEALSGERGECPTFVENVLLNSRDAALLNGILMHGLDFDDTHIPAVAHLTTTTLPTAISTAWQADASVGDFFLANLCGLEIGARVGMAGAGRFHDAGYHPTAMAGAMSSSLVASRLTGLDAPSMVMAQGIAGSMAAGLMEFLEDGAWTKRFHAGWAASSGISAARFAASGWSGPGRVYEGRFGLFASHLGSAALGDGIFDDLGDQWETERIAVKPYPVCHFIHAFADAAQILRDEPGFDPARIEQVRCLIDPTEREVVCDPQESKQRPRTDYEAKFSLQYVVASVLCHGTFTLDDLSPEALVRADVLDLARRVVIDDDPASAFPAAYSGQVDLEMDDGERLSCREQINRGHGDRPLSNEEIVDKFRSTAGLALGDESVEAVIRTVLDIDLAAPARDLIGRITSHA